MKKIMSIAAAAMMVSAETFAGGLLTNTNQNAAYTRQMSQDGIIDITGLYANPAGTAFLTNGWHLSLNSQTARQQRNIETTFPLFADGVANTKTFKGKAFAPVIPSLTVSYNKDKWSISGHFALIGGGGKCEFADGLGSFQQSYMEKIAGIANSTVSGAAGGAVNPDYRFNDYNMEAYLKGRSYTFGLQLGGTYKFTDNIAAYVGVRLQYATNSYEGHVRNVNATLYSPTLAYVTSANPAMAPLAGYVTLPRALDNEQYALELDKCDQSAFGVAPIIGLDYKMNEHWNFAARYEAPTKLNLKNTTKMNAVAQTEATDPNSPLAQFADGAKVREDIPGLLSLGVMYSPIEKVRIMAGFHEFFDKSAKKFGDKQDLLDKNTWEVNVGVEYDICKLITVSASFQNTKYGQSDAFMNDVSFNNSNKMIGGGLRINASKRCAIDLGYMYTFYEDRTVNTATAAGIKTDVYSRKNYTYGLGVSLAF